MAQGSPDPSEIKSGVYAVEPMHTQIGFSLSHLGFTNFSGLFSGASGTLRLDAANPSASQLEVSVPVQSVITTVPKLDGELKSDQWFDATRFPVATFKSTSITPTGNGDATVTGDLTLHGVTKAIVLRAHFVGAGTNPLDKAYTVGFQATGVIKRGDFGAAISG
jgi:polyisoprenoid-binding protein YceI